MKRSHVLGILSASCLLAFGLTAPVHAIEACTPLNFQDGTLQGVTTASVSGTQLWHVTNGICRAELAGHTTPFALYYGQDGTCNYDTGARNAANAISPAINLTNLKNATLAFNSLLFVESSSSFDTTFVDVSTDGGTTWTQVLAKANLVNNNNWQSVSQSIANVVGSASSMSLRFRFDSVDNLVNASTGWMVDDIQVCGERPVPTMSAWATAILALLLGALSLLFLKFKRR